MYNLFLDDIREPSHVNYRTKFIQVIDFSLFRLKEWVIVRSYDAFVKTVEERGLPSMYYFCFTD